MLIKQLSEYILRGRKEASLVAGSCAIIPFMSWLSVVAMALVTLRKGATEGFFLLSLLVLVNSLSIVFGQFSLLYGLGGTATWVLAIVLRETGSWTMVIQTATALGVIAVLTVHGFVDNLTGYWLKLFKGYSLDAKLALQITAAELKNMLQLMSQMATGVQTLILLFAALVNLSIARLMQACVFCPGELSKELYGIRLGRSAIIVLAAILIALLSNVTLAWDILPLVLGLFFFAGLSLIHSLAKMTKATLIILAVFYVSLILQFPFVALMVVSMATVDILIDVRTKVKQQIA